MKRSAILDSAFFMSEHVYFPGNKSTNVYLWHIIAIACIIYIKPIKKVGINMQTIPKPLVLANQWTIVSSVLAALIFQNYWILLVSFVFGISQLAFGFHPIMKITKSFLSKPLNTYIQEDRDQQKFNQYIALTFLAIAIVSGIFHFTILSIISTIMVGLAAFIAIMGFCVGCFIRFQYQQWKYRRKNPSY